MAKLAALLGFSSVSAKLFKFAQRVHGQTLARFAALLALNDLVIDKHITVLTSAVAEFLETGSRHAGTSAWKSVARARRRPQATAASRPGSRRL